ncbi:MAG: glutathione S-transferase family protein [Spirochaetota bacterium]
MAHIQLFELSPTRSDRARWALLEADLDYESIGKKVEIIGSQELLAVHPLGKLPAVLIDGKPLFESAAIVTAIADLVPEKNLIAKPGTWNRNLHYQWMSFILSELEPYVNSTEINSLDFVLPKGQHVPSIIPQNAMLFQRHAKALEKRLQSENYLVANQFSVTDIISAYTLHWGQEQKLLDKFPNLIAYLERLYAREHCPLVQPNQSL